MRAPHQIPSLAVVSERLNAAAQREHTALRFISASLTKRVKCHF
jgi:hypothetical protein